MKITLIIWLLLVSELELDLWHVTNLFQGSLSFTLRVVLEGERLIPSLRMFTQWPGCLVLTLIIEANLRLFCLLWIEVKINVRRTRSVSHFNAGSTTGAEEMAWQFSGHLTD